MKGHLAAEAAEDLVEEEHEACMGFGACHHGKGHLAAEEGLGFRVTWKGFIAKGGGDMKGHLAAEAAEDLVEEEHEGEGGVFVEGVLDEAGQPVGGEGAVHQQQATQEPACILGQGCPLHGFAVQNDVRREIWVA